MKTDMALFFAACGGLLTFLVGPIDGFIFALLAFIILDYITGVLGALITHSLSSKVGFKGLIKKVVILIMVAIANILDEQVLHTGGTIRNTVICFFLANEGVSLLENAKRMGLPIPEKLLDVLDSLKSDDKEV